MSTHAHTFFLFQMTGEMAGALLSEVERLDSMIAYKKQLVDTNIRCPLCQEVCMCVCMYMDTNIRCPLSKGVCMCVCIYIYMYVYA